MVSSNPSVDGKIDNLFYGVKSFGGLSEKKHDCFQARIQKPMLFTEMRCEVFERYYGSTIAVDIRMINIHRTFSGLKKVFSIKKIFFMNVIRLIDDST